MTFSPLSMALSLAITGPAFFGFVMASDRHYPNVPIPGSGVAWVDESGALTVFRNGQTPTICERSLSEEIDIREQMVLRTPISNLSMDGAVDHSKAHFQLTHSVMFRSEPLKYNRQWKGVCRISNGESMIAVYPLVARLPSEAIPVSYRTEEEVSACLKINLEGDVVDFKFAHMSRKPSKSVAQKIEKVARKCWKFDNQSDEIGWVQVGLDRHEKATSL